MNRIRGMRSLTLLVVCALSLSLIGAAAPPGSVDAPRTLLNEQWLSGTVTGNGAGAFAYFAINYPGDNSVVTVELRHWPGDAVTNNGFGFNVYASNGFVIGHGRRLENIGGAGVLLLEYADDNPATWLVQVYNYLHGYDVSYGIVARGLPPVPPPPPVAAPPPAGSQLLNAGYLTGGSGGIYVFCNVTVVAGAPDVQLTLISWPDDPLIANGVGLVAYGPNGWIGRGERTRNFGERKLTLAANAPGVYRIQVHNYINGLTIRYTLTSTPVTQ